MRELNQLEEAQSSLAMELLQTQKAAMKRMHTTILALIVAIVMIVFGFLLYLLQYEFYYEIIQEVDGIEGTNINMQIGSEGGGILTNTEVCPEQFQDFLDWKSGDE